MKKKQLITSLAVTGIMVGSMVGNAFADDTTITDTTTTAPTTTNNTETNVPTVTYTEEDGTILTNPITNSTVLVNTFDAKLDRELDAILKYSSTLEDSIIRCNSFLSLKSNLKLSLGIENNIQHSYKPLENANDTQYYDIENKVKIASPDGRDSFLIRVHTKKGLKNKGNYKVLASFSNNQVTFTVITTKGARLGLLSNCQGIIDNKITLSNGDTTLLDINTFHYSFIGYGQRDINIYLDSEAKEIAASAVEDNAVQENVAPVVEENSALVNQENIAPTVEENTTSDVQEDLAPVDQEIAQ